MAKKEGFGFGFIPSEAEHHFLVSIPSSKDSKVIIYESFIWNGEDKFVIDEKYVKAKVELSKHKWNQIEEALKNEFNKRLKKHNITVGRWKAGFVPVERLLGKEMVLLAWAIEDSDPSVIPMAIKNWLGLSPEERWWLFTMTNASTGSIYDKRGWRKAVRYALTENPVAEKNKQENLFEYLFEKNLKEQFGD